MRKPPQLLWTFFLLALLARPVAAAVTVTMGYGHDPAGRIARVISRFEAANPGIRVRRIELPASTNLQHDRYVTAFAAKDATFDLIGIDIIWLAEMAGAGWLRPLDRFLSAGERESFVPSLLDAMTYRGSVYAIPWYTDVGLLYYRKDLLTEAGLPPPRTWEELERAIKIIKGRHKIEGIVFQGNRYEGLICNAMEWLSGNGVTLFPRSGETGLLSPATAETIEAMRRWVRVDRLAVAAVTSYQEQESLVLFSQGRAVFLRNWPYAYAILNSPESALRGKVGILPVPSRLPGRSHGTLGGWSLAIPAFSRHPEEAWRLLQAFVSEEAQVETALEAGNLPTREAAYRNPRIREIAPHMIEIHQFLKRGRPRPVTPFYPKISTILQDQFHRALTGEIPVKAALREADRKIKRLYTRYRLPFDW